MTIRELHEEEQREAAMLDRFKEARHEQALREFHAACVHETFAAHWQMLNDKHKEGLRKINRGANALLLIVWLSVFAAVMLPFIALLFR